MPFRLVLILSTMAASLLGAAVEPQLFTRWATDLLAEVKPLDPIPSLPVKSVEIQAGRNEDGTLFYPGRPSRIGGHTEYVAPLARLDGRQAADESADQTLKEPYLRESRPETSLKVRQDLGEVLDRAAARSGGAI